MTAYPKDGHLSEPALDLLLFAGDGVDDASRRAREHIAACAECASHFDSLRRSAKYFELNVRARTEPRVVEAPGCDLREGRSSGRRRWAFSSFGVAAACTALVLVLVARVAPRRRDGADDEFRVKGGPSITVFRRHAGTVSVLSEGAHVEPGDALRFTARPAGHRWLLVASVDAAGRPTVYVPFGGSGSAPIDPWRLFEDAGSIILDATRGPERVFALFSDRPITSADATGALADIGRWGSEGIRSTRRLPIAAEFQTSLLLEK
jgi:hypothetical protein